MPIRENREYRAMAIPAADAETKSVEGYASTFDSYVLFVEDGIAYSERIDPHAFDSADMSDVIFQKDHTGTVLARTSNGTIEISIDEHGLKQRTDLSKTAAAREAFEEIQAGMYTQMSFAFTVEADHFEKDTRTRVIDRIRKVYDVSAVSFPANPNTNIGISARSLFDGFIEEEKQELLDREKQMKRIKILAELEK